MQRQIMENGENPEAREMRDQCLPGLKGGHDHIKHVVSLFAFGWDTREPDVICLSPRSQLARVGFPDLSPPRLNLIAVFELCTEERRQQVRGQITRADIHPRVLVHLAAEKTASIGSLFSKTFGALIKLRIIDQQRAAFSAREILCFVETESCQPPECAQVSPLISCVKAMRIVFDYCYGMPPCDWHDRLHFARDARVMHKKNGLGVSGNALVDLGLINVERIRANIHKDRSSAAQDKRI